MADDTVASLGFEVNSKPLDDAKQKLSEVSTEAGKTGKAVDDFNAKVGKTGGEASKAAEGIGKVDPALRAVEAAAKRAGTSVAEMQARTAAFGAESAKLATTSAAAAASIGTIAKEAGAIAPALGAVGAATRAVVQEHNSHNNALSSLKNNLKGMSPLLNQFGGGLHDVLGYSKAARLGLEGLALVAGGAALLALEKINDEIERSKNRLAGLTGSAEGGAKAYDAVKSAASGAGIETKALAGAVESAIIGQEKFADKNVIYADSADRAAKKTAEVAAAFGTFGAVMQANLANADEENKALKALGDSFQKTGTLTTDAFNKIRSESPSTALAIANAFGFKAVKDFISELDKAPISLDQFVRRMAQVKPQVDQLFNPDQPKNFEQALRGVTQAGSDLLETLAKAGALDGFKNILVGTKKEIEALSTPLQTLSTAFQEAGQKSERSWSDLLDVTRDQSKSLGKNIEDNVEGAVLKVLATLGRLPGEGIASITEWANGAIAQFQRMASGAVSAAQTAVNALSQIKAGGGGNPGNTDALGNPMGGTGGASDGLAGVQLTPEGDAGTLDFGNLNGGDLPAFATGGQFTVAGSGGTDSQVVAFKSTPGEVVTVSTPEQMAGQSSAQTLTGAASSVPTATATVKDITDAIDQSTIDISKKVLEGSDSIVKALKELTGGVASSTVNPATGLPIASKTSTSSTSSASSGGGGGFTIRGGINASERDYAKDVAANKQAEAANAAAQGGYAGDPMYSRGYGSSVRGSSRSGASSFATMAATGQFAAINPNNSPAYSNSGYSSGAYGGDPYASDSSGPMAPYDSGSSAYSSTGSTVYGANSGGDNYSSPYGGSTGSITGNDPNTINYGGGSADYGYFKEGGAFTVGGPEGTDKSLVTLHATKGEKVIVMPKGAEPPNGVTVPATAPTSQAAVSDPSANITNKTININVQAGIQAESFIRSRAMIARGL